MEKPFRFDGSLNIWCFVLVEKQISLNSHSVKQQKLTSHFFYLIFNLSAKIFKFLRYFFWIDFYKDFSHWDFISLKLGMWILWSISRRVLSIFSLVICLKQRSDNNAFTQSPSKVKDTGNVHEIQAIKLFSTLTLGQITKKCTIDFCLCVHKLYA